MSLPSCFVGSDNGRLSEVKRRSGAVAENRPVGGDYWVARLSRVFAGGLCGGLNLTMPSKRLFNGVQDIWNVRSAALKCLKAREEETRKPAHEKDGK
jgi:hypothetical protein